jgi:hypothetical protein
LHGGGPASPPAFPERWHAIAVLTPNTDSQIWAAEAWYDWSAGAMRVRLCGVEEAGLDLLVVGNELFVIKVADSVVTRAIGPIPTTVAVPPPNWLADRGMALEGIGDLHGRSCEWWVGYSPCVNGYEGPPPPTPTPVCNWVWARAGDRMPWRMFFTNHDNPLGLPILGDFAMVSFTQFEPVAASDLAALVAQARGLATRPPGLLAASPIEALLDALRKALPDAPTDPLPGGAGALVKGLGPAPTDARPPSWEPRLYLTGFTLPTARGPTPAALPMRVFYEWPQLHMLTRLSLSATSITDVSLQDMVLNGDITVIFQRDTDGTITCRGTKPVGLPKPDWGAQDGGKVRAVLVDNPVFGPGETINLTVMPSMGGRVFWVWYTTTGHGLVFMEVPQFGDVGLVLTDYAHFGFDPPPFDPALFTVPEKCQPAPTAS